MALIVGLICAQVFVLSALDAALIGELMSGTTGLTSLVSLIIFVLGVALFGISVIRAKCISEKALTEARSSPLSMCSMMVSRV